MQYLASLFGPMSKLGPSRSAKHSGRRRAVFTLSEVKIVDFIIFERLIHSGHGNAAAIADAFIAGHLPPDNLHTDRPLVFAGREKSTDQEAVIKVILKANLSSAASEHGWQNMCSSVLGLPYHPLLLTIYGIYEDAERYYIVSEMLHGRELFQFLMREVSVSEELCKHLIRQILLALEFMHMRKLVHRDVKPENLMFRSTPSGVAFPQRRADLPYTQVVAKQIREYLQQYELVLIDLDTAKPLSRANESGQPESGPRKKRLVGTYNYMAPELLRGSDHTPASDLWSVGVILFILMTGVPPLLMNQMHNYESTAAAHRAAERSGGINFETYPLTSFPAARDLCQKLLQFDPKARLDCATAALNHPWLAKSAPLSASYYMASKAEFVAQSWGCDAAKRVRARALQHCAPVPLPPQSWFTLPTTLGSAMAAKPRTPLPSTPTQKARPAKELSGVSTMAQSGSDDGGSATPHFRTSGFMC